MHEEINEEYKETVKLLKEDNNNHKKFVTKESIEKSEKFAKDITIITSSVSTFLTKVNNITGQKSAEMILQMMTSLFIFNISNSNIDKAMKIINNLNKKLKENMIRLDKLKNKGVQQ